MFAGLLLALLAAAPAAAQDTGVWQPLSGFPRLEVFSLAIGDEGAIYAGASDAIYRSDDGGDVWTRLEGLDSLAFTALAETPDGWLFAGSHGGGIFRSADRGDTWETVNAGLNTLDIGDLVADSSGRLYASAFLGPVYRWMEGGAVWDEVLNPGLGSPFSPALAVTPAGVVFSGTDDGVYTSIDEGAAWEVPSSMGNPYVESLAIGRDGAVFAGTDAGVYRSLDSGATWEAVHTDALGATNVRALVVTPTNTLFAGTHRAGVFRTLDNGVTWEAVNDGLADLDIHALAATADALLFAGTIGGGLFRRDVATDVANEPAVSLPASYALEANYPNPFNPSTTIRFGLPEAAAVTVSVYDVAGRRIAVLVQATLAAGWHEASFDAGALPSGVYFYRLDAGSHREVRQMVLLR